MKTLNFWRTLLFSALAVFAFASCVDDNDDTQAPYLEVAPQTVAFDLDGTAAAGATFEIKTNRPWTATADEWITISPSEGTGSATVSVSVAAGTAMSGQIAVSISNSVGPLATEYVTVSRGTVVPEATIFNETCGDAAVSSPWPLVSAYTSWNTTGEGAANVTYSGDNASVRSSGLANNGSGPNVIFFGTAPATFTVNKIALTSAQTNLKLTFLASYSSNNNGTYDNVFDPSYMTVALSADGEKWTNISYTKDSGDSATPYWITATSNFSLTAAASELYIRFTANKTSVLRLDDVTLVTGNGGTSIDLSNGTTGNEPAVTTADAAAVTGSSATLGGSVSNVETSALTAVGVQYIAFSTGTVTDIDWTKATQTAAAAIATPWTVAVTGLTDQTQYAFRAYATTATGTIYGEPKTFVAMTVASETITIPNLLKLITATTAAEVLDAEKTYTFEAVICGDPVVNNASYGTLYVMTPGATTGNNGLVLYNTSFGADKSNYKLGDKVTVTLPAGVAMQQLRYSIPQISGITSDDVVVTSSNNTVTPIKVSSVNDISNYYSMPVTISATTSEAGVWMASEANTTVSLTSGSSSLAVYFNKNAFATFSTAAYSATTADITGIASVYSGTYQVMPRNLDDVKAFASSAPTITGVNPSALTWDASATNAQTITVSGSGIDGKLSATSSAATSAFTISVSGTTVTVTPKAANSGDEIVETLTITAAGGNSETVVLTHKSASAGAATQIVLDFAAGVTATPALPTEKQSTPPAAASAHVIDGYTYKFTVSESYYVLSNSKLLIGKSGSYLELPVVSGKKLASVEFTTPSGSSGKVTVGVKDASGAFVTGGEEQKLAASSTFTYTLSGTAKDTAYRLTVTNANNFQIEKLTLNYE